VYVQIISNVAESEDRNNIKLVQDLVKDHIKGHSLILLTLTMRGEICGIYCFDTLHDLIAFTDDLENQSAAYLAKEADPEGMRTIGKKLSIFVRLYNSIILWFQEY